MGKEGVTDAMLTRSRRDVLTYTSLAKGLNQMGVHRRTLGLVRRMSEEGIRMDGLSLACFLSAAAGSATVGSGKQLHGYAVKSGLHGWISVSNGLLDMYGKCGSIDEARKAFMGIRKRNVVSWNGMISVLASDGQFAGALSAFEDMRLTEVSPDGITFLLVLYACGHGGLEHGWEELRLGIVGEEAGGKLGDGVAKLLGDGLGVLALGGREEGSLTMEELSHQPCVPVEGQPLHDGGENGGLASGAGGLALARGWASAAVEPRSVVIRVPRFCGCRCFRFGPHSGNGER